MELWVGLASGIFASLVTLTVAWFALPKIRAEARKLNIEADDRIISRLYAEIERLDGELADVRDKFAALETAAATETEMLERENKRLRGEVRRLTRRVEGLESVLKVAPQITEEMQGLIDTLNKIEGGGE